MRIWNPCIRQSYIYIKGSLWWSYSGRIFLDIVGKIPSNSKVICSLWIQKWFVKRYRNLTWRRLQYLLPLAVCQTLYPTMLAAQTRKTSLQSLPVLLLLWNCKTEEMKRKITDYQLWRIAGDNFCLQPMFVRDPYPCRHRCCENSVWNVLHMDDDFLYVFSLSNVCNFLCAWDTAGGNGLWHYNSSKKHEMTTKPMWWLSMPQWQVVANSTLDSKLVSGNAIREMCVYRCSCKIIAARGRSPDFTTLEMPPCQALAVCFPDFLGDDKG